MNASGYVALTTEKNGRHFVFNIPFGTPYEDAIDALLALIPDVKEMKKQAEDQAAAQKAQQEEAASQPIEAELVS